MGQPKPSVIVLSAPLDGQRVEIDGSLWGMGGTSPKINWPSCPPTAWIDHQRRS